MQLSDGKTETECLINHTHIFDEFRNRATTTEKESVSEELDVVEEIYDTSHPDFVAACEIGKEMARMWALKLKADFPQHRFRVYYTQYDNPIVRFHLVRMDEPVWLADEQLRNAAEPSSEVRLYTTPTMSTVPSRSKILGPTEPARLN
jgi:hypothetical protein